VLSNAATFFRSLCFYTLSFLKGIQALEQHARTEDHQQNLRNKLNPLQLQMAVACHVHARGDSLPSNSHLPFICLKDKNLKAELVEALKMVSSNVPAMSCGIATTFKAMFGDGMFKGLCSWSC